MQPKWAINRNETAYAEGIYNVFDRLTASNTIDIIRVDQLNKSGHISLRVKPCAIVWVPVANELVLRCNTRLAHSLWSHVTDYCEENGIHPRWERKNLNPAEIDYIDCYY